MERGCDNRLITFHAASALRVIGGVSCLSLRDSYHDVPQQLSSPLLYLPPPKSLHTQQGSKPDIFFLVVLMA